MRTRTPFIEAFRKQQEDDQSTPLSSTVGEKAPIDTTPKRMSESFHKVVSNYGITIQHDFIDATVDLTSCA
jgi:hypothetical protein